MKTNRPTKKRNISSFLHPTETNKSKKKFCDQFYYLRKAKKCISYDNKLSRIYFNDNCDKSDSHYFTDASAIKE
jgi:hypothetical protein